MTYVTGARRFLPRGFSQGRGRPSHRTSLRERAPPSRPRALAPCNSDVEDAADGDLSACGSNSDAGSERHEDCL
jgi:hypothetical protein